MQDKLKKFTESIPFQIFVTLAIIVAGVVVGMETYPDLRLEHGKLLRSLNRSILWIFVLEIALKMAAEWPRPHHYFKDGWNVFDFAIVVACFLPFAGPAVTVVRLLRLLRVLRLINALPKLQILVGALIKSVPSMGYVTMLLLLLFYVYAVAAVFLFGHNDPIHFGDLATAMLSLFRVATLEDWTDIMYINMYGCAEYGYFGDVRMPCTEAEANPLLGALFFVSFVLFGTMIIMNLFVGVIMNGMEEAHADALRKRDAELKRAGRLPGVGDELAEIETQLVDLQDALKNVHRRLNDHRNSFPGAARS